VADRYRRSRRSWPDAQLGHPLGRQRLRQRLVGRPVEDALFTVTHEAGLHEQLDVAVGIGTGHVEAQRVGAATVTQQVLDQPEAHVAGIGAVDGVELHDRPFVAPSLPLDAGQAGDPAALFVDVEQV
jgi:hypothetical protein